MNIGIVTTWFERGAAYVSRAYMETLSVSHNVYIYARGGESYATKDTKWNLPCVTWAPHFHGISPGSGTALSMTHFSKWLRDNSIDVIIVNEQRRIDAIKETSQLGYVIGSYVDYYTRKTVPDFDVYDFLLCNTQRHYSVFRDHPGAIFIQWGTDVELFKPSRFYPDRCGSDTVSFFHSAGWGGTNLRKGTDLLVEAFGKVKGNAKLVIHSQVPVEKYGRTARLIEGDDRIEFIEKTVPAPGLYHLGDVFVYPSRLEGIGLCMPEALACGLPVITTDNAPMNEFVEDGVNGLLTHIARTQPRDDAYYWPETIADVDHLASRMQFYVDRPKVVAEHQKNARASAEEKFDWSRNSAFLRDYDFEKMIANKHIQQPLLTQRLKWYGRNLLLYMEKYACDAGRLILPASVVHLLKAPVRWKQKWDLRHGNTESGNVSDHVNAEETQDNCR